MAVFIGFFDFLFKFFLFFPLAWKTPEFSTSQCLAPATSVFLNFSHFSLSILFIFYPFVVTPSDACLLPFERELLRLKV
jgi:hypothetical protein